MRSNYLYLAIIASTLDIAASLPQGGDATPKKILVAIGDSFTSAVGAGQRESNDGHCRRFTNSYFNLLLREPVLNYDTDNKKSMNLACAGATTKVVQAQIGKDKRKPEIVAADHIVMSVGGNDIGFAQILNNCIYGWYRLGNCADTMKWAEDNINNEKFSTALKETFKKALAVNNDGLKEKDTQQLFVLGYPAFFNYKEASCDPPDYFSGGAIFESTDDKGKSEFTITTDMRKRIDDAIDNLNSKLKTAVESVNGYFVDPNSDPKDFYSDHRLCEPKGPNHEAYFFNNKNDLEVSSKIKRDTQSDDLKKVQDQIGKMPKEVGQDLNWIYTGEPTSEDGAESGSGRTIKNWFDWIPDLVVSDSFVRVFHPTSAGQKALKDAMQAKIETYNDVARLHSISPATGS